jgi:uncharacterized protein YbjT (DUF2867 family)
VAAREAGVKRVIDMVMLVSSTSAPTPRMRENYLSEQVFEWAGVGAAHVRAAVFYENIRALAASTLASQGTVLLPWGSDSTSVPLVAGEDVARVCASLLAKDTVPPGAAYPLIGEVLALRDIIATFARVLGREVRYVEVSDEQWRDAALARGINAHAVEHLSNLWQFFRNFPVRLPVTDTIEAVTGRKPKTFEEFVRDQRSTLT